MFKSVPGVPNSILREAYDKAYDAVLDREASVLHERHRAGHLGEGRLALELRALRKRKRTDEPGATLDTALFPNANRLRG